jgi:hypothetical protein
MFRVIHRKRPPYYYQFLIGFFSFDYFSFLISDYQFQNPHLRATPKRSFLAAESQPKNDPARKYIKPTAGFLPAVLPLAKQLGVLEQMASRRPTGRRQETVRFASSIWRRETPAKKPTKPQKQPTTKPKM